MSAYKDILKIAFRDLSKQLKVAEHFIIDIHDDANSWSFISKLAQLYEGVFTALIVERLGEPSIYGAISNLPQAVRIGLLHDLEVITKQQKLLFLTVAEIRNDYIHNISNVNIELNNYLSTLKSSRQNEIFGRFKPFISNKEITLQKFNEDCKNHIFIACAGEALKAYANVTSLQAEGKHRKFLAEMGEKLLPKKSEDSLFLEYRIEIHDYVKNARACLKKGGLL